MAKSKSNMKVTALRPAAKGRSRKGAAEPAASVTDNPPAAPATERGPGTKQALVLGLLRRKQGASLAELIEATGWLPHSTRAALTRLRQTGHVVEKEKRETGETAYRIAAAPQRSRARSGRSQASASATSLPPRSAGGSGSAASSPRLRGA
jgi:hypothetical protein